MNEKLINGIRTGLASLRENLVEPMGLSITAHDGAFGWGFFKFKALPGHPNPGNAGNGWSHPAYTSNSKLPISAPRDWPQGGSFPWDWETTLDEANSFALEIGRLTGFGTDFTLECAWSTKDDMTVPNTKGKLSDMVLLRGGAEHYEYYPSSEDDISYDKGQGSPIDAQMEEKVRSKFCTLKDSEHKLTDAYIAPPNIANPITVSGAWYVDSLEAGIVAELTDGKLVSFPISPFRGLNEENFMQYRGQHPRRQHGVPLPSVLYPYYGLSKSDESLSEVLRVRITPSEMEKIKAIADAAGKNVSGFIRDLIRDLDA